MGKEVLVTITQLTSQLSSYIGGYRNSVAVRGLNPADRVSLGIRFPMTISFRCLRRWDFGATKYSSRA